MLLATAIIQVSMVLLTSPAPSLILDMALLLVKLPPPVSSPIPAIVRPPPVLFYYFPTALIVAHRS